MAHFSIHGVRNGRRVVVTWTDGKLGGDPETVAWIEELARLYDGQMMGQVGGPYTTHDHLASPYTARSLIRSVFPHGTTTMKGELPEIKLPPGAVM